MGLFSKIGNFIGKVKNAAVKVGSIILSPNPLMAAAQALRGGLAAQKKEEVNEPPQEGENVLGKVQGSGQGSGPMQGKSGGGGGGGNGSGGGFMEKAMGFIKQYWYFILIPVVLIPIGYFLLKKKAVGVRRSRTAPARKARAANRRRVIKRKR